VFSGQGNYRGAAAANNTLGKAFFHLGELRKSRWHLEQALELERGTGRRFYEADGLTWLSEVHLASHDKGSAITALAEALGILQELGHSEAPAVAAKLSNLVSGER
jgi:hypothetical protein